MEAARSPSSTEDENADLFAAVLEILDQDKLPNLVAAALARLHQPVDFDLRVGDPLYGSYHVLFPLKYQSELNPRWLVKIPINGTPSKWDQLSAEALSSEANTMRFLRRATSIPLPYVLDYSSTTDNPLSCPYILMTYVAGKSLYDVWFGHRLHGLSDATVHQCRTRALQEIALAMAQLGRYSFPESGFPVFGSDGELIPRVTQPSRCIDVRAELDRWFIQHNPNDQPIYATIPSLKGPKAYYGFMINYHPVEDPVSKGTAKLLLQLIDWIPEPAGDSAFVLGHPDFDIQNFIVSEKGELLAIIDWDGVAAMPRTLGSERYPGWLTRDWDPMMYGYRESMEQGVEPEGVWEDSPAILRQYRGIYAQMIGAATLKIDSNKSLCQLSLITENLAIAANDPRCRNSILRKVVDEIWAVLGRTDENMGFSELALLFNEENPDEDIVEKLHQGFVKLLSKEGL